MCRKHQVLDQGKPPYSSLNVNIVKVNQLKEFKDQVTYLLDDILREFVEPGSPFEINISGRQRQKLMEAIPKFKLALTEDIFSETHEHIYGIMYRDVFPRFIKNELTKYALNALKWDENDGLNTPGLGDAFVVTGKPPCLPFTNLANQVFIIT